MGFAIRQAMPTQVQTRWCTVAGGAESSAAPVQCARAKPCLGDWLAFVLPSPPDRSAAEQLRSERREGFYRDLPAKFVSKSRAQLTKLMDDKHTGIIPCPACRTGYLRNKEDKKGRLFWYCSNWNASSDQCGVTFADDLGQPAISDGSIG